VSPSATRPPAGPPTVSGVEAVIAPAKLTLSLRITGVRDDGYHLLDAEMVSLSLHDVLTFRPGPTGVDAIGPFAEGVPADGDNLVARALALAGRSAHVTLDKRIPHGGGLGGGSADAAAALRWAGFHDLERASRIGADVPFCLVGGRARVRGIGEVVEPLPFEPRSVTLVVPPLHVSTPAVYRAWDDLGHPTAEGPNDLEPAALVVEPRLVRWRDRIRDACGAAPVLAGSGATWFVHGGRVDALAELCDEGAVVIAARTVPAGWDGSDAAGTT
jgi:4-diphosphocytidyl-2-C-methyl-D-erythritol kinase